MDNKWVPENHMFNSSFECIEKYPEEPAVMIPNINNLTQTKLREIILNSALDVPNFMSIKEFDKEIDFVYNEIMKTLRGNL